MINLKFKLLKRNGTFATTVIQNITKIGPLDCLVDTGARLPVWCSTERDFLNVYPNAIKLNAISFLSGFGHGTEQVSLYKIPDFELSDGSKTIHFINLIVALLNKDFTFDMILSYTMLNKMNISIDTYTNRTDTNNYVPNLRIAALKDTYNIGIKQKSFPNAVLNNKGNNKKVYSDIYIFTQ